MAKFVIYTKNRCPFCTAAKAWMQQNGHQYEENNVEVVPNLMVELRAKLGTNGKILVPQIWIGEYHIGGHDDLMEAVQNGTLDMLLGSMENPRG